MMDKLHEECGVFGIFRRSGETVVPETYHALYALQHRGQDSCGICVNTDGVMKKYRENGMVKTFPYLRCFPLSLGVGLL